MGNKNKRVWFPFKVEHSLIVYCIKETQDVCSVKDDELENWFQAELLKTICCLQSKISRL